VTARAVRTLGQGLDQTDDDPRLVELADAMAAYITQLADEQGDDYVDDADVEPPLVKLMDRLAFDTAPQARRLIELLKKRGWTGWTKLERVDRCHMRYSRRLLVREGWRSLAMVLASI
jgi:hypothetical protein